MAKEEELEGDVPGDPMYDMVAVYTGTRNRSTMREIMKTHRIGYDRARRILEKLEAARVVERIPDDLELIYRGIAL